MSITAKLDPNSVANVAKRFPIGSRCWVVNVDNKRHGDEVIVVGRAHKSDHRFSKNVRVPVRSLVDGDEYHVTHTNITLDAVVREEGNLDAMKAAQSAMRLREAEEAVRFAQVSLGFEMYAEVEAKFDAQCAQDWNRVEPVVGALTNSGSGVCGKVTLVGPSYPAWNAVKGSHTKSREHTVSIYNGQVSWSAFGTVCPQEAAAYARAIQYAVSIVEAR